MQKVSELQVSVSDLKAFEALANIPDDQLQWLIDKSEILTFEDGEYLMEPGQDLTGPHFIIEGNMRFFMMQQGSRRDYTMVEKGSITGYMPYSRGLIAKGYAQAVGELTVLSYPTAEIMEMIRNHFELTQALVHIMTTRVRDFTAMQQQNDKMMALGKLSAGLAHELNNPASAIVRDSLSLRKHLRMVPAHLKNMFAIRASDEQVDGLTDELFRILNKKECYTRLTLKQRTQLEDEISEWLEDNGVEDAYDIAESFVDFSFTTENLEALKSHIPEHAVPIIMGWLSAKLMGEKMIEDIQESARRIAELVSSVKTFTHMDRAQDKQYADIHVGIRNTITMLGYKIRKENITVIEEFDETLPEVKALIGELNQVWTNLVDNALDAMEINERGTLTIRTKKDNDFVEVRIIDDGPGIPEDNISQIYDPFFTTKEMGKGTGMGLEVVQRIVKQHRGSIKVKSRPGHTEFIVCFPING
ncbi:MULTISPECIES: ATP-binding protein [Mucilaginibacter]|jgi:signal transduction histidine kinase|uniref:ATP-binding protein n=1 Tax=Mucilaginibacter TaxID=423349 RepID=UPI0008712FB3|nr:MULTISPECIES: ATP-binding protein [Mucilaginibacter]NVM67142.1 signal transduction histidine kinase [Mucilaginibacter sp. SG538B]GGB18654.1 sensor histidine kinase [Mucilaginibacter rubeus]SCW81385.1 Histidine kinase-, DNA gyrase B-, and HSP90-like ATPase [Mucilaginibacter sp. NFR10]